MALTTLPTAAFATGSVGTSQLADGAVTTEKLVADVNFRNLIINGDMSIAQRGTSVSSVTSTGYRTCDRFQPVMNSSGTWTISQSTDVPGGQSVYGFSNSFKFDCTTVDASPNYLFLKHAMEGQMLQYLKKGTPNAESLTLSFWVKSNKTGTYQVNIRDQVNSRIIGNTYAISSANTWEKKIITFAGDTTGTLDNNNNTALYLEWWLDSGSTYNTGSVPTSWEAASNADRAAGLTVNLADNTSNEWYITGVQLEVGTSASDFEFLPYDVNLLRCQRYYLLIGKDDGTGKYIANSYYYNNTQLKVHIEPPVEFRATPSVEQVTATNWLIAYHNGSGDQISNSLILDGTDSKRFISIYATAGNVSGTGGMAAGLYLSTGPGGFLALNAEL